MTADSTVIDTIHTWRNYNDKMKVDAAYRFYIPAEPARYIILAQHPEYEDCYVDHEVKYIGRKIDNLTLNGKDLDFFKGDNRVMLDNLPNYMVQNVEVYEK